MLYFCTVKKVALIIALFIMVKPIIPLVEYMVNYDFIANVLCENKAKPEMHCNGKCHLMKELAKASESEKPINSDKKDSSKNEIEILFFQEIWAQQFVINFGHNKSNINAEYKDTYAFLNATSVFHPPTLV